MLAKLKSVLDHLPRTIDEYKNTISFLTERPFNPSSLYACERAGETADKLKRFFDEDIPFIFGNSIDFWSGDLCKRVETLSNNGNSTIAFTKREVIAMMCCLSIGCFKGGINNIDFLQWQQRYQPDSFLILEEYIHQMRTCPNLDEPFTIKTNSLELSALESMESLLQSTVPLSKVSTTLSQRIEDSKDYSFIDFANKHIGGASLHSPCAQEEILFLIYPECCLSMAFAHTMKPNEAIRIRGCSRVANYTGYGSSFQYDTPYQAPSELNEVIAIDAIPYGGREQFSEESVLRDINKAFIGFQLSSSDRKGIASGKWGCGCYGGDPCLKCLQQWIAASLAHKEVGMNERSYLQLLLCLFGDREVEEAMKILMNAGMKTVGDLMKVDILCVLSGGIPS